MAGVGIAGAIGLIVIYVAFFGLLIAMYVFMIILMIKANKALTIWIRKNDTDIIPTFPPAPPTPTVETNFNPEE